MLEASLVGCVAEDSLENASVLQDCVWAPSLHLQHEDLNWQSVSADLLRSSA